MSIDERVYSRMFVGVMADRGQVGNYLSRAMERLRHAQAHLRPAAAAAANAGSVITVDAATITELPDTYGNRWALATTGHVAVSPSFEPPLTNLGPNAPWRHVDGPPEQGGEPLVAVSPDEAGFVWLATATRMWVMSPRAASSGPFEPGPGHSGKPTANAADPEWRLCPGLPELRPPRIVGLGRSTADAPGAVLLSEGGGEIELLVGHDGTARLGPPVASPGGNTWKLLGRLPCGKCVSAGVHSAAGCTTTAALPQHHSARHTPRRLLSGDCAQPRRVLLRARREALALRRHEL